MSNSIKLTGKKLDNFLSRLSELVDTLPSQETKSRLDQELKALIEFLKDFQIRLKSLPTGEDAGGITSAIETIKDCVRVAESDPVMSRALGVSSDNGSSKRSPHNSLTKQSREEARVIAEKLKKLLPGDVERRLADKRKYNIPMLKQIGGELGLSIPSKSTRLSIIEKITKKTANLRGYNYLRNGRHESIGEYGSEAEEKSAQKRQKQGEHIDFPESGINVTDGS